MWIETLVAISLILPFYRFHLWITRDVDWNFYVPWYRWRTMHFISGLPEMWIETFSVIFYGTISQISSLDYQRCGLKPSKARPMKVFRRFHLWITRDVDWNPLQSSQIDSANVFHLWITRDVDWNIKPFVNRTKVSYFISGLPEMWIETRRRRALPDVRGFHLWITRDVDWNRRSGALPGWCRISSLDYQRCGLKLISSIPAFEIFIFHLWITRDVDWNHRFC